MFRQIFVVLKREIMIAHRSPQALINPILFFIMVVSLFPLAISPERKILHLIAPGVIWVAALLASLMSMERMFKTDYEDGSLEQFVLNPYPLSFMAFSKVVSHWVLTGLPLIIITPVIALMYGLSLKACVAMELSLLLGTPILSFLGAILNALTVGLNNSAVLLTLLALPFYIPVLIFGTSAVSAAMAGLPYSGQLALLGAFLMLAATLSPFAIAGSLRISVNY